MADIGSFDQILNNFVGGHGKYQILVTLATSIIYNFAQGIFLIHIFTAYAPPHRCRVPQCEATNTTKVFFHHLTHCLLRKGPFFILHKDIVVGG